MSEYRPSPAERMTSLLGGARPEAGRRPGARPSDGAYEPQEARGWVPDIGPPRPVEEALPEESPRPRWSITVAAALSVVLLALLGVGGYLAFGREPQATPVLATAPAATPPAVPSQVVVHVAGAVVMPGIVELPAGSRVADAVEAAGGLGEDAAVGAINLARVLEDGEQIVVPKEGESAPPAAPQESGTGAASGAPATGGDKVNLNTADSTALQELPGVGPATAEKIIAYRDENGSFATVDELDDVSGIGPKTMERLRDLVTV